MSEQQAATESHSTATVVTSENRAEFMAQRLGLADPAPAPAESTTEKPESKQTEQVEKGPSAEDAPDDASAAGEKKPNPKIEKRFSELTQKRREAEAAAEAERARAAELEARLKAYESQSTPQTEAPAAEQKPDPSKYTDAFKYAEDLAAWTTRQALAQRDKQEAEARANAERAKVAQTWAERVEKARVDLPDFVEMIQSSEVRVSDQVRDAIMESDVGPHILYQLADDPELAAAINKMPIARAMKEIGRLEARLEAKAETKPAAVKSKAPPPITPLSSANATPGSPLTPDGEFKGTYQEYKALRKAGKIR